MARVIFAFPPIKSDKGYPTASQNRQFQYFKDPTFVYPIIPATAAAMMQVGKHEVLWLDAIAEMIDEVEFGKIITQNPPDYIVFEANTPLINRYYEIINGLKYNLPKVKIILCGEHVTALPAEAKEKCKADYFIEGGKWYYKAFEIVNGKKWNTQYGLPHIHRDNSRWWLYAYKNGNFKYIPGTYIMAGHDCWHRPGCTFCSWSNYHKDYLIRPVEDVLKEVEELIEFGFKEIFDDSGTFPTGEWLEVFCKEMIRRKYNEHISFGCNMRFGALKDHDFINMAKAGFRMVLWGFESSSQETLNRLNKKVDVRSIPRDLALAKAAGLQSHVTVMFGYPWEDYKSALQTYKMARWMLLKNYAFSAQATICIPYPGTPLFDYCKEKGLLLTENWDEYDMSRAVMKIPFPEKELFKLQRGIYNIVYHPKFLWNKFKAVHCWEDFKYYLRVGRKVYDRFGNFNIIGKAVRD